MLARQLIDFAEIPGGEDLRLFKRGGDFMIVLDRNELMSTRMSGSEEALAQMTFERLTGDAPRLLIGGYGMGFTLRAALALAREAAQITVVELVPKIIDWARGPMAALSAGCLDDARVVLVEDDVANVLEHARESYEAILLDVDNGPDGLVRAANNRLYSTRGLAAARRALVQGGLLAIWSAGGDPAFKRRLCDAGFEVEEVAVRARRNGKGPRHVIWVARKA